MPVSMHVYEHLEMLFVRSTQNLCEMFTTNIDYNGKITQMTKILEILSTDTYNLSPFNGHSIFYLLYST